jgi:hypothetical protein
MVRPLAVLALFSALFLNQAQAQTSSSPEEPILTGYITRAISLSDFDVNGIHVTANPDTQLRYGSTALRQAIDWSHPIYLGETVVIYGKFGKNRHEVVAKEILLRTPESRQLNGMAIIDRIFPSMKPALLLVRADGYLIQITSATKTYFTGPLVSLADVTTNTWVQYRATQHADGVITAENIAFIPNEIPDAELKRLHKIEYDPSTVSTSASQSEESKLFLGTKFDRIPPYPDPAMQQRIERIGNSLVPAYQKKLRASDPTKINFRFQLVDPPTWVDDARALPNGIILVPRYLVELLKDDSRLAAVLADNIAAVIEKQQYRATRKKTNLAVCSALMGGSFIPVVGYASLTAAIVKCGRVKMSDYYDQSGRVALGLLRDAGYDIQQAPQAWWTIEAAKHNKDMSSTPPPDRAMNLYRTIGAEGDGSYAISGSNPTLPASSHTN